MQSKRPHLLAALLLLAVLVGGLGWTIYTPVRQERLNRALIVAIKQNDTKAALALLAEGADANARDEPPQHLSPWQILLARLRGKRPASSTAHTALLLTCMHPPNDVREAQSLVKALLDRGAHVEVKDEDTCLTPLFYAVMNDEVGVSRLLIEQGANVNPATDAQREDYGTPLLWAAGHNDKELVRLLVNRGADVNVVGNTDTCNGTPLMVCQVMEDDDPTITEILLSRGAKVNRGDEPGDTPLMAAIDMYRPKTVRVLLQHGADVNLKNSDGDTPLKRAKERGYLKIVQMLQQAGAKG